MFRTLNGLSNTGGGMSLIKMYNLGDLTDVSATRVNLGATSSNVPNSLVARDASGNFSSTDVTLSKLICSNIDTGNINTQLSFNNRDLTNIAHCACGILEVSDVTYSNAFSALTQYDDISFQLCGFKEVGAVQCGAITSSGNLALGTNNITCGAINCKNSVSITLNEMSIKHNLDTLFLGIQTDYLMPANRFGIGLNPATHVEGLRTFIWNYMNTPMRFGTNNLERIRISSNGNIGIGTSTPSALLDVLGSAKVSGSLSCGALTASGIVTIGSNISLNDYEFNISGTEGVVRSANMYADSLTTTGILFTNSIRASLPGSSITFSTFNGTTSGSFDNHGNFKIGNNVIIWNTKDISCNLLYAQIGMNANYSPIRNVSNISKQLWSLTSTSSQTFSNLSNTITPIPSATFTSTAGVFSVRYNIPFTFYDEQSLIFTCRITFTGTNNVTIYVRVSNLDGTAIGASTAVSYASASGVSGTIMNIDLALGPMGLLVDTKYLITIFDTPTATVSYTMICPEISAFY